MRNARLIIIVTWVFEIVACVKPYQPDVIKAQNNFLVVDGIINCAPNSETTITLTRTRSLNDTVTSLPERFAQLTIEGTAGEVYPLLEQEGGIYKSAPLYLQATRRYRLKISTVSGAEFASDYTQPTITPPIDSLNWKQESNNITILVSTHDPQNNTRYYRWEYDETWAAHAAYESFLKLKDGKVTYRDSSEFTYTCYHSKPATDILQLSTAQLSDDIIIQTPLVVLPILSPKFEVRYSINVKQFALPKEAYEYWQILKRNTQQLGSIFDAQPSQLIGNLHNLSVKDEPVIGYITAATVQQKRLFIRQSEVIGGYHPQTGCKATIVPTDSAAYFLQDQVSALAYFVGSGGGAVAITTKECVDCRLQSGTTQKPDFWP
ncbi:MAG TPA: DUF4249 domain-containing protein [Niastella sp.]|nr:DUF4249 domain-containing protein [Niastella sp.]